MLCNAPQGEEPRLYSPVLLLEEGCVPSLTNFEEPLQQILTLQFAFTRLVGDARTSSETSHPKYYANRM